MFKRLFVLSGFIAFILAVSTMWYWYLPNQETNNASQIELNQEQQDTVVVDTTRAD